MTDRRPDKNHNFTTLCQAHKIDFGQPTKVNMESPTPTTPPLCDESTKTTPTEKTNHFSTAIELDMLAFCTIGLPPLPVLTKEAIFPTITEHGCTMQPTVSIFLTRNFYGIWTSPKQWYDASIKVQWVTTKHTPQTTIDLTHLPDDPPSPWTFMQTLPLFQDTYGKKLKKQAQYLPRPTTIRYSDLPWDTCNKRKHNQIENIHEMWDKDIQGWGKRIRVSTGKEYDRLSFYCRRAMQLSTLEVNKVFHPDIEIFYPPSPPPSAF